MADRDERRAAIVASAVELLDDEGLDGLSMRRLRDRTGASTTSVYWYVKNKDELVALTLDAVIAEVGLADPAALGWREAAARMARDFRAMMLRHPWLGLVAATFQSAFGERLARHNEHVVAVYEAAGFRGADAAHAEAAVYAYVLGAAVGEAGPRAWRSGAGAPEPDHEAAMRDAREAAAPYPRLAARLDELAGADPAVLAEDAFEFGLQAVLDGLQARLDA